MRSHKLPAEEGLRWLLCNEDAVLGRGTTFRDGWVSGGDDYDGAMVRRVERSDGRVIAARPVEKIRKLRTRFQALSLTERNVLLAAYGPIMWKELAGVISPEARNAVDRALGDYVGVALMTRALADLVEPGEEKQVTRWHQIDCMVGQQDETGRVVRWWSAWAPRPGTEPSAPHGVHNVSGPFSTPEGATLLDLCRKRSTKLEPVRTQAIAAVAAALSSWWGTTERIDVEDFVA